MGVPQGLTKKLEDLQRALEVLNEATVQEREDNAAARAQNEVLKSAVGWYSRVQGLQKYH